MAGRSRPLGCVLWPAVVVSLGLLLGCGDATVLPVRVVDTPNILVYVVDTLRADHLGLYGYERPTSPRLDAFARDAIVFERAYAPSPWTRPSVASLLTGLYPIHHAVRTRANKVPNDVTLLSEHLSRKGYRTIAVVTNPNIVPLWGFEQGFDRFVDVGATRDGPQPDADALNAVLLAQISAVTEFPFFAYAHAMDPHGPYNPQPPFNRQFVDVPQPVWRPALLSPTVAAAAFANHVAQYDGEIAFADHEFGCLLDALKAMQLYDDMLVVLAADHGEELLDHSGGGHGHTLYEELVHVPLLIKMPTNAFAGRRISAPIGLIDIVPTILTYLGDTDGVGLDGRDLAPLIQDDPSALADRPLFFDLDLKRADGTLNVSSGVLTGDVKFISVARPSETELLFDLATDPNERASVRHSEPESAARLKALLDGHRRTGKRRDANVTTAEMGNELGERLEALGYLAPHPSP